MSYFLNFIGTEKNGSTQRLLEQTSFYFIAHKSLPFKNWYSNVLVSASQDSHLIIWKEEKKWKYNKSKYVKHQSGFSINKNIFILNHRKSSLKFTLAQFPSQFSSPFWAYFELVYFCTLVKVKNYTTNLTTPKPRGKWKGKFKRWKNILKD